MDIKEEFYPLRKFLILLWMVLLPVPVLVAQPTWTETTRLTDDKAYLTTGIIEFFTPPDRLWQILTDYERADTWLVRGLDSPAGWKYPTYIQSVHFYPAEQAMEIQYGLRFLGILERNDLSIRFAIREVRDGGVNSLILTLTEEYPFVTEGEYILSLKKARTGNTQVNYSVRTKLPTLIRTFLPKGLYTDNIRYFIGQMIENLHERSSLPLNP
jgi:hypothetical protein